MTRPLPLLRPAPQAAAEPPLRVAFLSHTAMGGPFVVGSHHLAASFAASGCDVLHVSPPLSLGHLARAWDPFMRARVQRWMRGGSHIRNVKDVVPFTPMPWAFARTCAPLRKSYLSLMLASPTKSLRTLQLQNADALVIDEPRLGGLASRKRNQIVVYRATDLYGVMRQDPSIVDAERAVCDRADVLIGTSEGVAAHLRKLTGRTVHVIGNGVEFAHFSARREETRDLDLPGERCQRAIYVGAFDGRFSQEAVSEASRALKDKTFILAGPGSDKAARDLARSNVIALGPVRYAELPRLLHQCSVGLLPFSSAAGNSGRSPMKLFEYAAARLAVAATSALPLKSGAIPGLRVAASEDEFPAAVAAAFQCSADEEVMRAASARARSEDWSAKAASLRGLIEHAASRGISRRTPWN